MDIKEQFKHQWRAYFKRGEGEAIVYGNSEDEAKVAALAAYRKKKTAVDMLNVDDIVYSVEFIG
jgi:hypothetical protein